MLKEYLNNKTWSMDNKYKLKDNFNVKIINQQSLDKTDTLKLELNKDYLKDDFHTKTCKTVLQRFDMVMDKKKWKQDMSAKLSQRYSEFTIGYTLLDIKNTISF